MVIFARGRRSVIMLNRPRARGSKNRLFYFQKCYALIANLVLLRVNACFTRQLDAKPNFRAQIGRRSSSGCTSPAVLVNSCHCPTELA